MTAEPLLGLDAKAYGDRFKDDLLELYRLYLASAEKISDRRLSSNRFFLAVNTEIVGAGAYALSTPLTWLEPVVGIFISAAGLALCYTWYRLIRSYRGLNSAKFKIFAQVEKELPFSPFAVEWDQLQHGKDPKVYLPFTKVEQRIPWVFFVLHLSSIAASVIGIAGRLRLFSA